MASSPYDLSLLKIPVSDIEVSANFYRDTLAFESQFVAAEYGWAQFVAGDLPLGLYKPGMGGGNGTIGGSLDFHLVSPPETFDQLVPDLLDRGVLDGNMIHQGDDGGTFIEVVDPDKNTLKIVRGSE